MGHKIKFFTSISIFLLCIIYVRNSFGDEEYNSANLLAQEGIIQNWEAFPLNYKLDEGITRREMLKIIINISGDKIDGRCVGLFQDMNGNDWGCKYAEAAVKSGFITQNNFFRPDDNVTQIEALKMIMQALRIEKFANDDWKAGYLAAARYQNIISEDTYQYDDIALRRNVFNITAIGLGNNQEIDLGEYETTIKYLTDTVIYKSVDNVDLDLLSLDIYYPSDTENTKAIIMYIHGGGWAIGDKAAQLDNKISLFESLNYVFVSVNYRLSPFPYKLRDEGRIKYPIHNQDVASAIAWVVDNINSYGGDNSKIALMGHSAGAHLVSLTATNESFLRDEGLSFNDIAGIISIDTEGYDIVEQITNGSEQRIFENAFGSNETFQKEASPIYNLSPDKNHPPFFIGKRVVEDRVDSSDDFIDTLTINNVPVTVVDGSSYTHAEINDAIGNPNDIIITPKLIKFLEDIFE